MKQDSSTRIPFSGLFLFDRANAHFIQGSSSQTAKQKNLLRTSIVAIFISVVFGGVMTSLHNEDASVSQRLKEHGKSTKGVVLKKWATSSGQGRDFCYVAYRFKASQHPNVPLTTFEREAMVSDSVFDHVSEGQTVTVIYDEDAPDTSMLAASMLSPRYPSWLMWCWWIAGVIVVIWLVAEYWRQRRFSKRGLLIRGSITAFSREVKSGNDTIEVRYCFDSPTGTRILAVNQAQPEITNVSHVLPHAMNFDAVAVLYLNDGSFTAL